jgi:hypothetical protein
VARLAKPGLAQDCSRPVDLAARRFMTPASAVPAGVGGPKIPGGAVASAWEALEPVTPTQKPGGDRRLTELGKLAYATTITLI